MARDMIEHLFLAVLVGHVGLGLERDPVTLDPVDHLRALQRVGIMVDDLEQLEGLLARRLLRFLLRICRRGARTVARPLVAGHDRVVRLRRDHLAVLIELLARDRDIIIERLAALDENLVLGRNVVDDVLRTRRGGPCSPNRCRGQQQAANCFQHRITLPANVAFGNGKMALFAGATSIER